MCLCEISISLMLSLRCPLSKSSLHEVDKLNRISFWLQQNLTFGVSALKHLCKVINRSSFLSLFQPLFFFVTEFETHKFSSSQKANNQPTDNNNNNNKKITAGFRLANPFLFIHLNGAGIFRSSHLYPNLEGEEKRGELLQHVAKRTEYKIPKTGEGVFTFNNKFSWTLHSAQRVFCYDFVISTVLGPNFEYNHGTDSTCIGDVVVSVGIEADIISVPGNMGSGVSCHRTTHVALVALWTVVCFQWNSEWWKCLKVAVLRFRKGQRKCFWNN